MTITVAINHKTFYDFDRSVEISPHIIRLRPAPHGRTPIKSYSLKVEPGEHFINWQQDPYNNYLARIVFNEKATRLAIEVEVIADLTVINPFDFFIEDYAEHYPFEYDKSLRKQLKPYLKSSDEGKLFKKFLKSIPTEKLRTIDFLAHINQRLQKMIAYGVRLEPGIQTPEETLELNKGSCRDTAWLLVQVLRHLGLAARFASGYLVQLAPDEKPLDGPAGTDKDFTDLHAWCEVFLPGAGWVGLDPTSGLYASEGHIPLACTPNPSYASPIEGATEKCEVTFSYSNEVTRIHEDPRVTKPYTDKQWADIVALGNKVQQSLNENDVRLTMGGEPTFVSIDDMESAQWNTEALGKEKLALAKSLLLKLRDHFAPQGLLHYGQGKWYPGEEIPRWALGIFWRTDGEPLWRRKEALARIDQDYGHTIEDAEKFAKRLTQLIDVPSYCAHPAYEDGLHYLLEEQNLPVGIDGKIAKEKDDLGRRRLARVLQQGIDTPTGFVIPIEWNFTGNNWQSSKWEFRREQLTLIPGDSPIGLRLPLHSLPPATEEDRKPDADPMRDVDALETAEDAVQEALDRKKDHDDQYDAAKDGYRWKNLVRMAMCIEPRDGKLHIFLPPIPFLESYVNLLALIEETACQLELPVVIEGYEPPRDHRIQKLLVTPDPGVIEVNIHPAQDWEEMVHNMETLYESARLLRLGTEKFMLDGRHTGTGGGNHITLGGSTPADSPILRRPDLLRSFITYWQNHPSLSYLFSGAFIGPTSQAPRVDEGRDEILYELEIALQQIPDGEINQPWLIDRVMRNLLIDITGNTHRAEFCIDKLYAPGSATGRLGILEFRGFEMPPHSRMALVQSLLIRALVVRFWKQPYKQKLVRWGTRLHDQFMLPHYVWKDMQDVVEDLQSHGIDFQADWLEPFREFRFPRYGTVDLGDISLTLSWAIEPWNVLGEELSSAGNSRYVDSSVERLQVHITGMIDERYILACNGRAVPLRSTGRHGEFIAGVRYKAWAPPSALHPTIGVQAPLTFDLIDTWNNRSIGGCTYHVSHPGGRSYDAPPVNSYEAESRRGNRFTLTEHTQAPIATPDSNAEVTREFSVHTSPRPMSAPNTESHNDYPFTLDLRNAPKA